MAAAIEQVLDATKDAGNANTLKMFRSSDEGGGLMKSLPRTFFLVNAFKPMPPRSSKKLLQQVPVEAYTT